MKIQIIASGSKANCTYLECGKTRLLIDIGVNYKTIKDFLESKGLLPCTISGILITHTHNDHIRGLSSFIKKNNVKVYIIKSIYERIKNIIPHENIVIMEDNFNLNSISIRLIYTSHDVPSVGYFITYSEKTLIYITDTGYINEKYLPLLDNRDVYIIESNHDEEMLIKGPYCYELKQRILSDYGHLANKTTAKYLASVIGKKTKYVVLAHLSENNNTEELALQATLEEFKEHDKTCQHIVVAKQYENSELIEV